MYHLRQAAVAAVMGLLIFSFPVSAAEAEVREESIHAGLPAQMTMAPAGMPEAQMTAAPFTVPALQMKGTPVGIPVTQLRLNTTLIKTRTGTVRYLKAKISPSGAKKNRLTWTSSNKHVAAVDSKGKVTARHKGTAIISVSADGGRMRAFCSVIVRLVPEKVTVDKTSLNLYQKDQVQLKAHVYPKNASSTNVTWKSSDPRIASVNNRGVVTARSPGNVTLTVTTNMGLRQTTCKVTVNKSGYWVNSGGNMRYYDHGKALTGYKRIGNYYYLFDGSGNARSGIVSSGGRIYYIRTDNYRIEQIKSGGSYYNADGSYRDYSVGYDTDAYYYAKMYVDQLTTPAMSMSEKLYTCFMWAASFPYLDTREFYYQKDWVPLFAFDCFLGRGGPCYSTANAFAYMAKAIGYKNVYCCLDSATDADNAHGWAEVDGLCYDPLFYRAKGTMYYALPYSGWNEWPMVKVRLS